MQYHHADPKVCRWQELDARPISSCGVMRVIIGGCRSPAVPTTSYTPGRQELLRHLKELTVSQNVPSRLEQPSESNLEENAQYQLGHLVTKYKHEIQNAASKEQEKDKAVRTFDAFMQFRELRQRIEFHRWSDRSWLGFVKAAASGALATLAKGKNGPESAEQFLSRVFNHVLPASACGNAVNKVLEGYHAQNQPEKVISAASRFLDAPAPSRPSPTPTSLSVILESCHKLDKSEFLHGTWEMMVVPAVEKQFKGSLPMLVSSTYIWSSFQFDLADKKIRGLCGCLEEGTHVNRALKSISSMLGGKLAGPLLSTVHLISLLKVATTLADIELLMESSLGTKRIQHTSGVKGYRPNVSTEELLWQGEDVQARQTRSALGSALVKAYMKCGHTEKAVQVVSKMVKEGRGRIVLNAFLKVASTSSNVQVARSACQLLQENGLLPHAAVSRGFLSLLASTPQPWGHKHRVEALSSFGQQLLHRSGQNWACIVQIMALAGADLTQIMNTVECGLRRTSIEDVGQEELCRQQMHLLVAGARGVGLTRESLAVYGKACFKQILKLAQEDGRKLEGNWVDQIMAAYLGAVRDRHDKAIETGEMKQRLALCLRNGLLPGKKSVRALEHICNMAVSIRRSPFLYTNTDKLRAAGIDVLEIVRNEYKLARSTSTRKPDPEAVVRYVAKEIRHAIITHEMQYITESMGSLPIQELKSILSEGMGHVR